jgi:hypothetical protein
MRGPVVAGVARDFLPAAEVGLVDLHHHGHHLSSGLLVGLVVQIHFAGDVAEIALDAQRSRNELHGGDQLVGRRPFELDDVLEDLLRGLGLRRWRGAWIVRRLLRISEGRSRERGGKE